MAGWSSCRTGGNSWHLPHRTPSRWAQDLLNLLHQTTSHTTDDPFSRFPGLLLSPVPVQLWVRSFESRVVSVASRGNHVLVDLSNNITASVDGHNGRVSVHDAQGPLIHLAATWTIGEGTPVSTTSYSVACDTSRPLLCGVVWCRPFGCRPMTCGPLPSAPMATTPSWQRRKVGAHGALACRSSGVSREVVGHGIVSHILNSAPF